MDINVRMSGSGSKNARQQKVSAKSTHISNKTVMQHANSSGGSSPLKGMSKGVSAMTGFASGNAGALIGGSIITSGITLAFKGVDKIIQFGADVYKSVTGEDMIASNVKAYSKTISQGGLNLVAGSISNYLFTQPRIRRENNMRDYGRELYLNSFEKNKLS